MRLAVIDLGTNTFNLLIVDFYENGSFTTVFNTKEAVKIGEGAMMVGLLQPEPITRGKSALAGYVRIIEEHKCDKTFAFATSGIRSTSNGKDFVNEVKEEIGLHINIIDGDEEAQLIYDGVDLAVKFDDSPMVIMDIGGGSTEFIIANNSGVLWKKSYKLGISRILQMLEPSDPLTENDLNALDDLFKGELQELVSECLKHKVKTIIGSSGSFDSFAEMMWLQNGLDKTSKEVVSEEMDLNQLSALHNTLVKMNAADRRNIPGLVEMRVDTIHLASYMVQWVLGACSLERLLLSTYALKEGVLHRAIQHRI
jgi:exopolyphosphatase/guanosine-5'-triphosphate,3'-diphosphate pyrophosphatase